MVIVPPLVGIALAGPALVHLPLLALWWVGYFFFFATGLWLRSGFKARYRPPVTAYGVGVAVLGGLLLAIQPALAWWVIPYAPLVALTFWQSFRRRDRSMFNDTVTVVAAGLMTAVMYDAAAAARSALQAGWPWTWLVTLLVTAYFLGTVFYVKTNIRERDSLGWLIASIAYHALFVALTAALSLTGATIAGHGVTVAHVLVWGALLVRAAAVPILRHREGTRLHAMSAKRLAIVIGIGEIVFSVLVPLTLLAG